MIHTDEKFLTYFLKYVMMSAIILQMLIQDLTGVWIYKKNISYIYKICKNLYNVKINKNDYNTIYQSRQKIISYAWKEK